MYFPLHNEQECVMEETRSFLEKVHGGSIEPMLAAFVENEKLSPEKIAKLKQILDSNAAINKKEK